MLSDDDVDLAELTDAELDQAWDLWFDLAQTTNDDDPAYTHGVFQSAIASPAATGAANGGVPPALSIPHARDALRGRRGAGG
jgi:hypothetical protein